MLAIAALVCAPAAQAQTIRGSVLDDETRGPIAGAVVELRSTDGSRVATGQTNRAGLFLLSTRRAGTYTLHLVHLGYTSIDSDTLTLRSDEAVQMELRMARTTIPLEPLVVIARSTGHLEGFRDRMRRGGFGHFVTREDIERRPGATMTTLVREVPGVTIVSVVPPGDLIDPVRVSTISLRSGLGGCDPTIFIDGLVVQQAGHLGGIDELLRPEQLEGVEVYVGAAVPAPLYARDGCGVVAFWTRPGEGMARWTWTRFGAGFSAFALAVTLTRALSR
jgi:hypothetical protein